MFYGDGRERERERVREINNRNQWRVSILGNAFFFILVLTCYLYTKSNLLVSLVLVWKVSCL